MLFKVITCILFSLMFVLGQHSESLAQDIGDDYYVPQDHFPDIYLAWFGGHDEEKSPEPNGHSSNIGVTNAEYKGIVEDVMELISALKDFGVVVAEEIRIIKEIIHSKKQ